MSQIVTETAAKMAKQNVQKPSNPVVYTGFSIRDPLLETVHVFP